MKKIISLVKNYSREEHRKILKGSIKKSNLDWTLKTIYSTNWENGGNVKIPYEVLTHMLDSYYQIPERPDLAFSMCWHAINNSYNEILFKNDQISNLSDSKGLKALINYIDNSYDKYYLSMKPYYDNIPSKICRFIASYFLKGYVIDAKKIEKKFNKSSYYTFVKNFENLSEIIKKTYGEKYLEICTPKVVDFKLSFGIKDKEKSRKIIYSLGEKLNELIKLGTVNINQPSSKKNYTINFNSNKKTKFLIYAVIYAIRCNNFHGNVASRLCSSYSNEESYLSNKYIYLLSHNILVILLNINGYLNDIEFVKFNVNSRLL